MPEDCLRREIEEETGAVLQDIGPLIWQRHHTFDWDGQMLCQNEEFRLVPIDEFDPDFTANPSEVERIAFRQFKWWTPEEISVSRDAFAPRLLAQHLRALIEQGITEAPIDVGV